MYELKNNISKRKKESGYKYILPIGNQIKMNADESQGQHEA